MKLFRRDGIEVATDRSENAIAGDLRLVSSSAQAARVKAGVAAGMAYAENGVAMAARKGSRRARAGTRNFN